MNSKLSIERNGTGTKEWSDRSYNICSGCEHGCLYCFAKSQAARFHPLMREPGAWQKQKLNPRRLRLGREIGPVGVVMFPSSHDLTPNFLPESLQTIKNLADNNEVLVVSKAHFDVFKTLCRELTDFKNKILFRVSIGSLKPAQCAYWEPGAPTPTERIKALRHAFECGYQTSVSCEPMLDDRKGICELVNMVEPYVTDTIWAGKMQRVPQKFNAHIPDFGIELAKIRARQTDSEILELVKSLGGHQKIRWKDSIQKVLLSSKLHQGPV